MTCIDKRGFSVPVLKLCNTDHQPEGHCAITTLCPLIPSPLICLCLSIDHTFTHITPPVITCSSSDCTPSSSSSLSSHHSAKPSFSVSSAHKKKGDILQPCDTEYPSFVYEPSVKETNSIIKCGRCQKMFVVQQIPESNLLMLVVQADCDCSRQYGPLTMEPREVRYNASVKCERMKSQKIRRRPESCHAYHPQENANDCGRASFISLSASLFFICLSFSTLVS
ncbi:voltage-dependent calcium channel subunit alpha-2/delta-4-like [Trachinotus anak]|uniref:voltage-dependent calcium channel subunit alpha-2/delta-4-like n=1 Tax=Trachinotus anak TaxID=443729 RepID=UPI0039F196DD